MINNLTLDEKVNVLMSLLDIIRHLNETGIITVQKMCFSCTHYRKGEKNNEHFYNLLNRKLKDEEIRLNCLEHSPV